LPHEFDVVCLGGGVAGEAIAAGLRDSGLTLAVVERELVGGECPYWGCVPSKTLLRSGETLTEAGRGRALAASRVEWTVDFPKVATRVLWMARNLDDRRPAAAMEATGARLFRGEGRVTDLRTVEVGSEQLTARRAVVIANGSTAAVPPIPGLDTVDFWTNRQAAIPQELPVSLAILGGGPIGVELGQAFARLGTRVSVIEAGPSFLGVEEPEVGTALRPHLEADGMMLIVGDPCVGVEHPIMGPSRERSAVVLHLKSGATVRADRLLVATGRRPNVEGWQAAGLARTERGWLKVDPATLEVCPGVFGAGDVTRLGGFTHLAYYHGQVIARRLRGIDATADHTAVPRVTYTDPEVASVGLSEAAARASGIDVVVTAADPAETARGYIHDFHCGVIKLVADRQRGVLIGATLVSPRAGEIVGELVLAIKQHIPLRELADVIHPFPAFNRVLGESLGELAARTAPHSTTRSASQSSRPTEVTMSSTQTINERTTESPATAVDLKIEVVPLPVADVDRAKRFYEGLGWRVDADFTNGDEWRVVQLTPPGSPCSVSFGKGYTTAAPGSVQGTFLVVEDIEAARAELVGHGVDVSEVFHFDDNHLRVAGTKGRVSGPDPKRSSYFSFASFSDPDGNSWLLQEVTSRFPGRGFSSDVATMAELLREAEERHGNYERVAPKHHWSDWYSGYIVARQRGKTPEQAAEDAARQLERAAERAHA
jgi:pyruvate/2-oxoglutarate dehydrogenase complex dihydrolipoamide dehydrogenase (E3) component/catechol 2,3-dioxygenase-like lactoylglutathione lyase family enzyme